MTEKEKMFVRTLVYGNRTDSEKKQTYFNPIEENVFEFMKFEEKYGFNVFYPEVEEKLDGFLFNEKGCNKLIENWPQTDVGHTEYIIKAFDLIRKRNPNYILCFQKLAIPLNVLKIWTQTGSPYALQYIVYSFQEGRDEDESIKFLKEGQWNLEAFKVLASYPTKLTPEICRTSDQRFLKELWKIAEDFMAEREYENEWESKIIDELFEERKKRKRED
jgi:hypothetical protein